MLWSLRSAQLARPCLRRSFSLNNCRRQPRVPLFPAGSATSTSTSASLPSFREQVARAAEPKSFADHVQRPRIGKQIIFALVGSYVAYSLAAVETNRDTTYWTKKLMDANPLLQFRLPNSMDIAKAKYMQLGKDLQETLVNLKDKVTPISGTVGTVIVWTYAQVAQSFLDASEGRRTCWAICAVNTGVWVLWLVPRLKPVMAARFTHNPLSGLSYTMLTSTFSHASIFHLGFNCMALASFGTSAITHFVAQQRNNTYGMQESTASWHFLAFFISAGLFSGLVSHVASARIKFPRLVAQLSKAVEPAGHASKSTFRAAVTDAASSGSSSKTKRAMDILPSLGASGAIYAAVTLTALAYPDAVVSLIFPPTWPIPIQWGVGALVLVDVFGVLRGWRMLDHWAHLGGAAFGALYYAYGPQLWDWMRATNGGVVGKATTLSSTVSRDRLEMAVQVVLSEELPRTNEERLVWYNHERWLEAGGQACLQGPAFHLEGAMCILRCMRSHSKPENVYKVIRDDPVLCISAELARKMYDMSVVLERDKLPVALATVLSEDLPSSPDDRAEYCRAHLMHGSRLALEGPAFYLLAAMSLYRVLRAGNTSTDSLLKQVEGYLPPTVFELVEEMRQLSTRSPLSALTSSSRAYPSDVEKFGQSTDLNLTDEQFDQREQRFTSLVPQGEEFAKRGPDFHLHAASCFYRALRLYPDPSGLLELYSETVSPPIFKLLQEMTRLGTAMAEPVTSQSGEASPGGAVVGFEEPRSIPPVIIAGQRADWRPSY